MRCNVFLDFNPQLDINYGTLLKYIHPEDRVDLDNAIIDTLNGNSFDNDYRIILEDGEERIVHIKGEIIFNEENVPIRVKGIIQDITERKKAEEKIRNLANIVASSSDAIGTMSLEGIIATWNKGAEQVYGYSAKEIIGKPGSILTPSHLAKEPKKLIEMVKQGEEIREYETSRLRKDGKMIEVSLNISPVFDTYGKLTAISVIAIDITKRKKAEEKLRASEEKYRAIVETANEGIFWMNAEFKIIYANKRTAELLGYNSEEIIGKPVWDFISEEGKPIAEGSLKKRRRGINESYELKLICKDGSFLLAFINAKPFFNKCNAFTGSLGMFTDITKRKKAEEALANIEIVRKKEIHHRIKNNLQLISSLLDLQAEKFKGRKNINDSEVLNVFKESQDRIASMVLIHEELYRGREIDKLDFSYYIEKLVDNLFLTYKVENIDISLNMDLEENAFFDIDTAIPLGIMINELVSNSFKYAFQGRDKGEIRIKLSRNENGVCEKKGRNNNFTLTVSDDGIGIPDNLDIENLESLGLQLVTSLVDQLDGELELKRVNGTEFTIRFMVTEKDNLA
jgi:PAS domain S-box-containing protein